MNKSNPERIRRPDLSNDENDYLLKLGERVRDARARRGMTRKILAHDSGVSERYLAQLETGHGNVSIILLRQIARAMGLPLGDLVREEPDLPIELTLLTQYLGRLSPKKLSQARSVLMNVFGETENSGRRHRIALIGLRGAGKSTLGRMLATHLGVPFIELAREIEREAGTSLGEIFSLYGQAAYRRYERRCLDGVIEHNERFVLSTGGGLVSEAGTFDILLSNCFTVWIKASPEEHMERVIAQGDHRLTDNKPENMEDLRRILAGRISLYSKADAMVDTRHCSVEQSFADLCREVALATTSYTGAENLA